MRTEAQVQRALAKIENVAKFAREHRLPVRTVWRIRSGGSARNGTIALLDAALDIFEWDVQRKAKR